jgi:cytoskeletal protein CcmA (bactofilin family)
MAIFSNNARESGDPVPTRTDPQPHNRRRGDGIPLSIVAKDMTIVGDMETEGVVKVEGKVRGTIRGASQVIISPGAVIDGDVHTREAIVAGEVHGAIRATDRVELQATGSVAGDITTPRIAVLEGGRISGAVKMEVETQTITAPYVQLA